MCYVSVDTNGGTFPQDVYGITKLVVEKIPGDNWHSCPQCRGSMAVANPIMAVVAESATHVQGNF